MTLDDLVTIYEATKGTGPEWVPGEDAVVAVRNLRREKLAAVVKALQDELFPDVMVEPIWDLGDAMLVMDKILGDAGEKVAGTDTAKPEAIERSTPAAAPAPVCEWRSVGTSEDDAWISCGPPSRKFCPSCGLPIKFTEET